MHLLLVRGLSECNTVSQGASVHICYVFSEKQSHTLKLGGRVTRFTEEETVTGNRMSALTVAAWSPIDPAKGVKKKEVAGRSGARL